MKNINTLKSKQAQSKHNNMRYAVTLECFKELVHNGLVAQNRYYYIDNIYNSVMVEFNCNEQVIQYLLKILGWC